MPTTLGPNEALESSFVENTFTLSDGQPREFLWGCVLTKENPEVTWDFVEEDDDLDYINHTLFLRHVQHAHVDSSSRALLVGRIHSSQFWTIDICEDYNAVLGKGAIMDERNLVEVETKNYAAKDLKIPIASVTLGKTDMVNIDINFNHEIPVTFRLIEGSGPVCLTGQHLAEVPPPTEEEDEYDTEEGTVEETEEGDEEEEEEEELSPKKQIKRKASGLAPKKTKRGKLDSSARGAEQGSEEDEEEEEEEEDESMEEEDDDDGEDEDYDEDEDSSPEKKKSSKAKGKATGKAPAKAEKVKGKVKSAKVIKKAVGKKGRSK